MVHVETRTPASFEIQSGVSGSGEGEDCVGSVPRKLIFSVAVGKPWPLLRKTPFYECAVSLDYVGLR